MMCCVVVAFVLVNLASASYVSIFNACRSSGIKAYFGFTNDEANAELIVTLSKVGTHTTDEITYSPAYFWLRDDDNNLLLDGKFTFFTSGGNALGYIESSGSNCIPLKIELDATYSSRASVIYVNSIGVEDQYVFFDDELEGVVETEGSNTVLVTSHSGNYESHGSFVAFCDTAAIDSSTCTSTGSGDMTVPAGDAAFFVVYTPKSSSTRNIEWFTATGSMSGFGNGGSKDDDNEDTSLGAWIGLAIGCVCLIGCVGMCIYYIVLPNKSNDDQVDNFSSFNMQRSRR